MKTTFARKPKKCPNCGSQKIAVYLYGLPAYSTDLQKGLREGSIALGGCTITIDMPMPKWLCTNCKTDFFQRDESLRVS
jgi:hypothetical protein